MNAWHHIVQFLDPVISCTDNISLMIMADNMLLIESVHVDENACNGALFCAIRQIPFSAMILSVCLRKGIWL